MTIMKRFHNYETLARLQQTGERGRVLEERRTTD
jgi:hypothetical protein